MDYNSKGFYRGIHKNGTLYDDDGYDRRGYNEEGYNKMSYDKRGFDEKGLHKRTHTKYDNDGFNKKGIHRITKKKFDESGFNCYGVDKDGYNKEGRKLNDDIDWIHKSTNTKYNPEGFDSDDLHKDTGTEFDQSGYNINGYNEHGFNKNGYDENSYNEDGYDENGYNKDGFDKYNYDEDGIHINGQSYSPHSSRLEYDEVKSLYCGWAKVYDKSKGYNWVNKDRKFMSTAWYNDVSEFYEGWCLVHIYGKGYNWINKNGNYFSDTRYDKAGDLSGGSSAVIIDNRYNRLLIDGSLTGNRIECNTQKIEILKEIGCHATYDEDIYVNYDYFISKDENNIRSERGWNIDIKDGVLVNQNHFECNDLYDGYFSIYRYDLILHNNKTIAFVKDFFIKDGIINITHITDEDFRENDNNKFLVRIRMSFDELTNYIGRNILENEFYSKSGNKKERFAINNKEIENKNFGLERIYTQGRGRTRKSWGKNGKRIFDDRYDEINDFKEGYSLVKKEGLGRNFINNKGEYLF